MKYLRLLLPLSLIFQAYAFAADAPPAKALKYHEALLKRPSNETLFDRFFGAWIDEQDIAALEVFLKARAEENGGADLSVLARYQLRRGNEDDALATLGKAITALPADFTLPMERAKILLRRLEFENARKDLEKVAAGTDANLVLEASKLIGKSWLREGNPAQAIKTWDKLLAAHPGDEDLLEDLVESAAAEGEIEQALIYVDKLIAAGSDPYKKTLRQLRRGDLLAQAGRNDDAIKAYSATLSEVGEGSWLEREVLAQIDKSYRKQDRLDDLKKKLAELAEANPRRLLIHRQLAKIEAAQGDTDAAVGRFREVLKRSPGNRELREEFVRLLTDGEKYDEAVEELDKLIAIAPEDSGLQLQMADLRNRQGNKQATLAALEKAHSMLGKDEAAGIRISGLMFQYKLAEEGEKLLKALAAAENATAAPSEALAAEYSRTNRKPEALAIFKKIGASDNLEIVLRTAGSISALSENATALEILSAKAEAFGQEPRFLAAISQAALAAGKPEIAVTHAVKLVRLARQSTDLAESIGLALRAITEADKIADWRTTLEKQESRSPSETCLLASLADAQSDFDAASKFMEGATDPMIIRFHAALLDRRSEFEKAIAVLSSLAETEEGRKASYFKEMADLQRRAGLTDAALATVELWKQSAPGDKTAWITGGSILQENGRIEDAVKSGRQAVARFGEDTDLAATLASLHQEAGQTEDAEAIYWRLYDEASTPSDQARWSVRLAELAQRSGRTDELGEKLRERARGNRRSIGPILAQAELARITRDEDKRRDLLLEAVRLQPKDIDLRLQIANLEEQSGNPDRVIAILEEAVSADTSNRVRSALAQAYLRQGQTMKGMRELRALAGKQADDPRAIEQSAATLAGSGLYEEAIRFLREALPDGGDWRTRYLLAVMLEQDGRETEAIPIFQALRQASGELPNVKAPTNRNNYNPFENYPQATREIIRLMAASQAAYTHRNANNNNGGGYYGGNGARVGPFMLPDNVESVRTYSLVHLAKLGAEGVENRDFIKEITSNDTGGQPDFAKMLTKFPDQPGLLQITLLYTSWNEESGSIDKDLLRKILSEKKDLSATDRFRGYQILTSDAKDSDPAWQKLADATAEIAKEKSKDEFMQTAYQLLGLLSETKFEIPAKIRESLSKSMLEIASMKEMKDGPLAGIKLAAINVVGTPQQWIEAANSEVAEFRKENAKGAHTSSRPQNQYGMGGGYNSGMGGESPFSIPTLNDISLTSLPLEILATIRLKDEEDRYYSGLKPVDPITLVKSLGSLESPVFRAWVAMRAGDAAATEKALAVTPPENEATDFAALHALQALSKKDYPAAYSEFSALRPAYSADRNLITSLNFHLIAIASAMTKEQRVAIHDDLGALLIQARRTLGTQGAEMLAAQAEKLELPELATRFRPAAVKSSTGKSNLGAASFGNRTSSSSSSSGNATIEKMQKFAAAGKNEAAALEALNLIRKASSNSFGRSYEIRNIKQAITPAVSTELFKLADPGDSKSLTKLTEYADICLDFGKPEDALAVLTRLNKERPNDASIAAKLAFILPADQREFAIKLISSSAADDGFAQIAGAMAQNLSENENNSRSFAFFSTTADWLEKADPQSLAKANLTWISYYGKNFFGRGLTENMPSLSEPQPKQIENKKQYDEYVGIAKHLALAMLRHDSIAEEGFRLLSFSRAWTIPDGEMDGYARSVLMAAALRREQPNQRNQGSSIFQFRSNNGSMGGGDDLNENSSVRWITQRLAVAKSPDEILPPAFLEELKGKNANFGNLVSALAELKDIKGLEKIWSSDAMTKSEGSTSDMLRQGVLSRAGSIPGASGFFLKRITELKPGWTKSGMGDSDTSSNISLFIAALKASASGDAKGLTEICSAISKSIFGEKPDFSDAGDGMATYQALRIVGLIFESTELDAAMNIRIQSAFYRLGIPAGSSHFSSFRSLRNASISKPEDGVKLFASFGWLDDVDTWQPYAAIFLDPEQNGREISFTRKEIFLTPEAIPYFNISFSDSILVKQLEDRKPQTFGALITAACLVEGKERSRLTEKAFLNAAPKLATMPPERLASFSLILPWLPADALAKLPPAFRKKAEGANAERLAELTKIADAFLKTPQRNNNGNNMLDQVENTVAELAAIDLDKSVALFLEAERRFTTSLSQGGRLSSYSTDDMQITERDEGLQDILRDSDSQLGTNPELALAFHAAVARSPEATRFGFSDSRYGLPILYEIGGRIYDSATGQFNNENPRWLFAMRLVEKMQEAIRKDAYIALGTQFIGNHNTASEVKLPADRNSLLKMKDLPPALIAMRSICIGVSGWKSDTPDGKKATKDALFSYINDAEIPATTRFQLISMAVTMMPEILVDPAIAEAFATLFEGYANGERSIINTLGLHAQRSVGRAPVTDANKPFLIRINKAFWDNANAAKAGGHPAIPPNFSDDLFLAAANAGDTATTKKLFTVARPSIEGNIGVISLLIAGGNYEIAKDLLLPLNRCYTTSVDSLPYNRNFEQHLAEFKKIPGIDPIAILRIEALLTEAPSVSGNDKPTENDANRIQRVIATYKANPPTDRLLRTEILSRLTRDSHDAAIALHDQMLALCKELDLRKALSDWRNGTGNENDPVPRYIIAPAETVIFRQSAFLQLLDGDASGMEEIAKVLSEQLPVSNVPNHGERYHVKVFIDRISVSAPLWICEAVHLGKTEGFAKAFSPFEKMTLIADSRQEFSSWDTTKPVTMAEFFAFWSGESAKFEQLQKQLKRNAKAFNYLKERWGFLQFARIAKEQRLWSNPDFAKTRYDFFIKTFTRKEMTNYYGSTENWLNISANECALRGDILKISATPPAGISPTILTHLLNYRAKDDLGAKRFDKAIEAFHSAIDACPGDGDWLALRGILKCHLTRALVLSGKPEEAKAYYETIPKEELNKKDAKYQKTVRDLFTSALKKSAPKK